MLKSEWNYLITHKMMLIVLVAIALIPAIYCFIYLSSMWNTYGKMDDLPVAIVNHDQPVTYQGKHIAIGANLTKKLVTAHTLDFHHVSAATAARKLKSGQYYMVLTVPKHFSADATTILSAQPRTMPLYFRFNSGQNFIVSKMTSGAATAIKAKVSAQVTQLYATIVLNALDSAGNGMAKAAAGGAALTQGAGSLATGESQLSNGLQTMSAGIDRVVAGNEKLAAGNQAMTAGFGKLGTGNQSLGTAMQQITAGLRQLASSSPQLAAGSTKLTALAGAIQKQLAAGQPNQVVLQKEMNTLISGLQTVTSGSQASSAGTQALLTGSQRVGQGMTSTGQGTQTLAAANVQIGAGLNTMLADLPALQTGASKLTSGTAGLTQGTQKLLTGAQTLTTSLAAGATKLQTIHTATRNANHLAVPVKEVTSDIAKIPNNGTGMAPFAIAIGLYVGGIALGTMYEAFLPHQKPKHALTWWGSKASVIGLVGLLQAGLLYGSLMQGNHLQVSDHGLFFLVILLGSWLFVSLIFCLRLLLGGFGTWLVSIVLVLQLASSGGLYPTFLVNHFAQSLNAWLPMTYLINALRAVISTHQAIAGDLWIMVLITLGLNIAMILRFQLGLRQDVIIIED
ncbi:YhgE/Pip family protein [Schleiferilactobacillus harbinensis]|jgi:putative membrane protein|uniref:YhgE/Pip family protein n=1 Tax=Schleiferilactobacillus harbinensis TaxID=304207 RepID=UPI002431EAA2|nr:YhgE/Pip domain-containing protein [Schleiferilactobacillus harbinensis]MCI1686470.1 YhgE/Pip domain-containing protein [Schleiferilactobacillus harbinensis]MCI1782925.1 YhgE/Pip domain-containing protein [Schleiferilactobacillus harbinensis]MCI1850844.1 YhgE/Pip domain-containing protein [Schleiferilactobacillus harbinensis]